MNVYIEMSFEADLCEVEKIIKKAQEERESFISEVERLGFNEIKGIDKPITAISQFVYSKKYDNKEILIVLQHRDRCKTFVIRPDGVKIELIIKEEDKEISKKEFRWNEKAHFGGKDD